MNAVSVQSLHLVLGDPQTSFYDSAERSGGFHYRWECGCTADCGDDIESVTTLCQRHLDLFDPPVPRKRVV